VPHHHHRCPLEHHARRIVCGRDDADERDTTRHQALLRQSHFIPGESQSDSEPEDRDERC
jgi:hypothetical protein